MELNAAAAALANPQNSASTEMDSAPSLPCVTRKKVPSMASPIAAISRPPGRLRPASASHSATMAGAVNCRMVAVAVLEALIAAI